MNINQVEPGMILRNYGNSTEQYYDVQVLEVFKYTFSAKVITTCGVNGLGYQGLFIPTPFIIVNPVTVTHAIV